MIKRAIRRFFFVTINYSQSQKMYMQEYNKVTFFTIDEDNQGQRVDNFLIAKLKGVPKSMIYRIIRKNEVRVNKKRVKPDYKLQSGDLVRIPPVKTSEKQTAPISKNLSSVAGLEKNILFEDDCLIVLNKPSGMAVHGGSGLSFGVIEALRSLRSENRFLELVHRIDRDTSGILLIAKKRSTLRSLHQQLREKTVKKDYLALVRGNWQSRVKSVNAPLLKNELASGERVVKVCSDGKESKTLFKVEERYHNATLVKASPVTGRTHQIRVHTQHAGHPIACDDKYGDKEFETRVKKLGLNRLFLHAYSIKFMHPKTEQEMRITAPLDENLKQVLSLLRKESNDYER